MMTFKTTSFIASWDRCFFYLTCVCVCVTCYSLPQVLGNIFPQRSWTKTRFSVFHSTSCGPQKTFPTPWHIVVMFHVADELWWERWGWKWEKLQGLHLGAIFRFHVGFLLGFFAAMCISFLKFGWLPHFGFDRFDGEQSFTWKCKWKKLVHGWIPKFLLSISIK